jgi:hypothetical protein
VAVSVTVFPLASRSTASSCCGVIARRTVLSDSVVFRRLMLNRPLTKSGPTDSLRV